MPSTHFAVALVILIYVYRSYRRAGWLLLLLVIGLGIGTVWGRFHYVSDVVVGGIIGMISVLLVFRYGAGCNHPVLVHLDRREIKTEYVS